MLKFPELKSQIMKSITTISVINLVKQLIQIIKSFTYVPLSGRALGTCVTLLQHLLDEEKTDSIQDLQEIFNLFDNLIQRRHCPHLQICNFLSVAAAAHPNLVMSSPIIPQLLSLDLRYDEELVSGITSLTSSCLSCQQRECESFIDIDYLVDSGGLLRFLCSKDRPKKSSVMNLIDELVNFNEKYLERIELMGLPEFEVSA
jgi:hypothetical protein